MQHCSIPLSLFCVSALLKQFQPHTDTINSIELFTRSERLLVLTASSDCAVALWDIEGRHIGIFGQVEYQCLGLSIGQTESMYSCIFPATGRRVR